MEGISTILWDFDGVLMDSNSVRDFGFASVLADFPKKEVDELMIFHKKNGGLSRYVKFRYFFETIRNEGITDEEIQVWANKFSKIMLETLADPKLLIKETLSFVQREYKNYRMYIVSGSDGNELRTLCEKMKISDYFISINGSPTPKTKLVKTILEENQLLPEECLLIGDSFNDFEAAKDNSIYFKAYNNSALEEKTNYNFSLKP